MEPGNGEEEGALSWEWRVPRLSVLSFTGTSRQTKFMILWRPRGERGRGFRMQRLEATDRMGALSEAMNLVLAGEVSVLVSRRKGRPSKVKEVPRLYSMLEGVLRGLKEQLGIPFSMEDEAAVRGILSGWAKKAADSEVGLG